MKILSVGNCIERKGFTYLARAVEFLRWRRDVQWWHVGSGPELDEMLRLVPSMRAFHHVDKIPYGWADVVVVPSVTDKRGLREGLGLVAIEALLYSKWLVSTLNGGLVDATCHGQFCDPVPERDAHAIYDRLGQEGPCYNQQAASDYVLYEFNIGVIMQQTDNLVREALRHG